MPSGEGGQDIGFADESQIGPVMIDDRGAGNMSGQPFDGDRHSVLSGMELYCVRPHNLADSFKTSRWNTYGGPNNSFPLSWSLFLSSFLFSKPSASPGDGPNP